MAKKREINGKIIHSDEFTELPATSQALYFHLMQDADDDGFNDNVKIALFRSHATADDLKTLMIKNFLIRFDNGVVVIRHWRLHNAIRKDRYKPTDYQQELSKLGIEADGSYSDLVADRLPFGCHLVAKNIAKMQLGNPDFSDTNTVSNTNNKYYIYNNNKLDIDTDCIESSNNGGGKNATNIDYDSMIEERAFDPIVEEAVKKWVRYKTEEKKFKYKQTSFETLLNKVEREVAKKGAETVEEIIDNSIANTWTGIGWEYAVKPKPTGKTGYFKSLVDA